MVKAALASDKAEVRRLASDIYGVRERSKGAKADQKYTTNRSKEAEGR